jgi:hypothetical protein
MGIARDADDDVEADTGPRHQLKHTRSLLPSLTLKRVRKEERIKLIPARVVKK